MFSVYIIKRTDYYQFSSSFVLSRPEVESVHLVLEVKLLYDPSRPSVAWSVGRSVERYV